MAEPRALYGKHSGIICIIDKIVVAGMFAGATGAILFSLYQAEVGREEIADNIQTLVTIQQKLDNSDQYHEGHKRFHHIHAADGDIIQME